MRAIPMAIATPGMGTALPTPTVTSNVVRQAVDLKPAGNTVAIRTISDMPFEENRRVTIVTQASGGMAPAPASMQSTRLMHSFLPGIGNTATAEVAQDKKEYSFSDLLTAGTQVGLDYQKTELAKQQARIAEAEAARTQAGSLLQRTTADIGGVKINVPLVIVGVAAGGLALYLWMKSKKKAGK